MKLKRRKGKLSMLFGLSKNETVPNSPFQEVKGLSPELTKKKPDVYATCWNINLEQATDGTQKHEEIVGFEGFKKIVRSIDPVHRNRYMLNPAWDISFRGTIPDIMEVLTDPSFESFFKNTSPKKTTKTKDGEELVVNEWGHVVNKPTTEEELQSLVTWTNPNSSFYVKIEEFKKDNKNEVRDAVLQKLKSVITSTKDAALSPTINELFANKDYKAIAEEIKEGKDKAMAKINKLMGEESPSQLIKKIDGNKYLMVSISLLGNKDRDVQVSNVGRGNVLYKDLVYPIFKAYAKHKSPESDLNDLFKPESTSPGSTAKFIRNKCKNWKLLDNPVYDLIKEGLMNDKSLIVGGKVNIAKRTHSELVSLEKK